MQKIFPANAWIYALSLLLMVAACSPSAPDAVAPDGPTSSRPDQRPASTAAEAAPSTADSGAQVEASPVTTRVGAQVWADEGFSALDGKRVGVLTNSSARIDDRTVLDAMLAAGVEVTVVFTPEHGFDAEAAAGAVVADGFDDERGLPVVSLYGAGRAPSPADLTEVDVLVFDLQDVGVRAYTYVATMGLAMAAAAEAGIPFVVFDRPNPLGDRVREGWVRADGFESFVSQFPVPARHGMTAGEMARAIQGERWLAPADDVDLIVVGVEGWQRSTGWEATGLIWYPPSPSLPTTDSVVLYPGTVLLEATSLSLGRGTPAPFTVVGAPWVDGPALAEAMNGRGLPGVRFEPTEFTAVASPSVPDPPYAGVAVPGIRIVVLDLDTVRPVALGVHLLAELSTQARSAGQATVVDRPEMLDLLAGTDQLRLGLAAGRPAEELVAGWGPELAAFDQLRTPYLLYD